LFRTILGIGDLRTGVKDVLPEVKMVDPSLLVVDGPIHVVDFHMRVGKGEADQHPDNGQKDGEKKFLFMDG